MGRLASLVATGKAFNSHLLLTPEASYDTPQRGYNAGSKAALASEDTAVPTTAVVIPASDLHLVAREESREPRVLLVRKHPAFPSKLGTRELILCISVLNSHCPSEWAVPGLGRGCGHFPIANKAGSVQ